MSYVFKHMKESLKDHFLEQVLDAEKFKAFYLREKPDSRMMSTMIIFSPEGIVLMGDLRPGRHGNVSALGYGLNWFSGELSESYLCEKFLEKGWHSELAVKDLKEMAASVLKGEYDDLNWTGALRKASEARYGLIEDLLGYRKDLKEAKAEGNQEGVEDVRASIARTWEQIRPHRTVVRDFRGDLTGKLLALADECEFGGHTQHTFGEAFHQIDTSPDWYEDAPGWGWAPAEAGWLCAIQQRFAELYQARSLALAGEVK